jgi:hypothetical protein
MRTFLLLHRSTVVKIYYSVIIVRLIYFCEELVTQIEIMYMSIFWDISSEFRVVAMFAIVDLQTMLHT